MCTLSYGYLTLDCAESSFFFLCNNRRGHRGACDSVSVDEKWPLGCGWACGFADCFGHKMHHGNGRFGGFYVQVQYSLQRLDFLIFIVDMANLMDPNCFFLLQKRGFFEGISITLEGTQYENSYVLNKCPTVIDLQLYSSRVPPKKLRLQPD